MNDAQQAAVSAYNSALKKLQNGIDARSGAAGAEVAYVEAHKALVQLGVMTQLKAKYRNGKAHKQVR